MNSGKKKVAGIGWFSIPITIQRDFKNGFLIFVVFVAFPDIYLVIVTVFGEKRSLLWAVFTPSTIIVHSDPAFSWTNILYKSALSTEIDLSFRAN